MSTPHNNLRHSRNMSTTSSSSANARGPQGVFKNARLLAGSIPRVSRTNTENTEAVDAHSIKTLDRLSTAKQSATYLDKLWTQIDVLDDVKNMSANVKSKGSFFNKEFNEGLEKLKGTQDKLLEVMSSQSFNDNEHRKEMYRLNTVSTAESIKKSASRDDEADDEFKRQQRAHKLNEFFDETNRETSATTMLYHKQNFSELNEYVEEVKENLTKVGEAMKTFDQTTKEQW